MVEYCRLPVQQGVEIDRDGGEGSDRDNTAPARFVRVAPVRLSPPSGQCPDDGHDEHLHVADSRAAGNGTETDISYRSILVPAVSPSTRTPPPAAGRSPRAQSCASTCAFIIWLPKYDGQ